VGIGVASPSTTLHLSTTNGIRLQYTGNTGFIQFSTNGSNDYIFSGFDGERMRMTSAGSLGLGTTNPQAFFHMSLTGNSTRLRMEAGATYAALLDFYNSTTARWSIGIDNTQTYGKLENRVLATDAIRFYDSSNNVILCPTAGNALIGTTSDGGAKLSISQQSVSLMTQEVGNGNDQGNAINSKIVRHYPVVSLGTKLIIPFVSQGNLNSSTIVRIFGHSARFNSPAPVGFTVDFGVGHLQTLSNLAVYSSTGNVASVGISGMNIEITFTTPYTSVTSNGVYVTIEYMTNIPSYSIAVANITMN
jgi:hypothetical protein